MGTQLFGEWFARWKPDERCPNRGRKEELCKLIRSSGGRFFAYGIIRDKKRWKRNGLTATSAAEMKDLYEYARDRYYDWVTEQHKSLAPKSSPPRTPPVAAARQRPKAEW